MLDEKIVELRRLMKRLKHTDIKKGVYIKEMLTNFEKRTFFGLMSMYIPCNFLELPLELARVKYPSEQRPELILTNPVGTVNLSLSLYDKQIEESEIEQITCGYQAMIQKTQPSDLFFEKKLEYTNNRPLGWFDFKSYALDNQMYNLLFVMIIAKKLIVGMFNCIYNEFDEWKPTVIQMIHSITEN